LLHDQGVLGQEKFDPPLLRFSQNILGQTDLVGLAEGFTDLFSLGEPEGVGHPTADQDSVGFLQKEPQNPNFVTHLSPTQDHEKRALGIGELSAQVAQLLFHEQASRRLLGEPGTGLSGGMGAMSRAEGVIDIEFGGAEELFGESRIILLLFGVEADVFKQKDFARLEGGAEFIRLGADAIGCELDGFAENLGKVGGDRFQRELFLRLAFGPTEVTGEDEGGAFLKK